MSRRKVTDDLITEVVKGGHTEADPGQIALVRILAGEVADALDNLERIATALERIADAVAAKPDDHK